MQGGPRPDAEQMLVHNLKTPLTGLLATLEMLEDGDFGDLSPAQHQAIESMRGQGRELLALIDELLDVGRLEALGGRVATESVAVDPLLRNLAAEWSPRLGGRLRLTSTPALPDAIGDATLLRRVLGNLLMNATVHGGDGVSVRISAAEDHGWIRIDVSDDGPGVADGDADRIFELFGRGDHARRAASGSGSGVGLAYCRAAMQAQGGRIVLLRGDAPGAVFRLELPAAAAAVPVPGGSP
jgi:signal transduction histidine kinase